MTPALCYCGSSLHYTGHRIYLGSDIQYKQMLHCDSFDVTNSERNQEDTINQQHDNETTNVLVHIIPSEMFCHQNKFYK